jgi:hypothetical protein
LHKLRHTFCSHLAMRGAPAKAIQELAGHENVMTTLRYMHLSLAARKSGIALLNERVDDGVRGPILEKSWRRAPNRRSVPPNWRYLLRNSGDPNGN